MRPRTCGVCRSCARPGPWGAVPFRNRCQSWAFHFSGLIRRRRRLPDMGGIKSPRPAQAQTAGAVFRATREEVDGAGSIHLNVKCLRGSSQPAKRSMTSNHDAGNFVFLSQATFLMRSVVTGKAAVRADIPPHASMISVLLFMVRPYTKKNGAQHLFRVASSRKACNVMVWKRENDNEPMGQNHRRT